MVRSRRAVSQWELLWALIDVHGATVELAGDFDVPTEPDPSGRERLAPIMEG